MAKCWFDWKKLEHYKMGEESLTFGNIKIEKTTPIFWDI